jgi:hypothetical protein
MMKITELITKTGLMNNTLPSSILRLSAPPALGRFCLERATMMIRAKIFLKKNGNKKSD